MHARSSFSLFLLIAILIGTAHGQYSSPRISYTDLPSAPVSGGQNGLGAFITIYGNGFGAAQGSSTVTIGGVAVAQYVQWSDAKIVVQPGTAVVTGNIVVKVGATVSNAVAFTVRSGKIHFVSNSGSDSQRGTYAKPWRTILKAKNSMAAGDITYVMDGVTQLSDSNNAALSIGSSGTSSAPKALIAYPGAKVTIGSSTGQYYGIKSSGYSNWILAGITMRGSVEALDVATASNWRVVGNDISCPAGHGTAACLNFSGSQTVQVFGNNVHDAGSAAAADRTSYNSMNFSAANTVEVGWNKVANSGGCHALSFSSPTANQYGLSIHNNLISSVPCNGINLQNIDASLGKVQVSDNVVYRAANTCVSVGGSGMGTAQLANNTLYDCGAAMTADSGGLAASTPVSVVDNLVYVTSGENYVTPNTSTSWLSGSNNGGSFAGLQNSMVADPLFVNPAGLDFHLQSASPAINAGINSGVTADYDGVPRPQNAQYDIGAFEYAGAPASASVQLTQSPSTLSFGTVTVGASSTQSVTVTNTGGTSANIMQMSMAGAGFSATGLTLPVTLVPGQAVSYTVSFAPQTSGSVTGSVTLTANATGSSTSSTNSVQLSGTAAQPAGTLSANPTSISFGSVLVGSSVSQTVTVTAATASVTISQATATGSGFAVSGPALPLTLAAGQSAAFSVTFAPAVAGTASGSVSLVSNASNTPTTIAVSGTGTTPVVHSVSLSWVASISSGVVGYNVYRGTQSGGPYTKITSSAIAATTYTDSNVVAGATYYYVITAVDGSGTESSYSSQVSGTIPTP